MGKLGLGLVSGLVLRQLFIERVGLQTVLGRLPGSAPRANSQTASRGICKMELGVLLAFLARKLAVSTSCPPK